MRTLASFRNAHRGASIIVCGCGNSLSGFDRPDRLVTIGVNDVGRLFQPTYLVIVDAREHFNGDRFKYVETAQARYIFTQRTDLGLSHPGVVHFQLGDRDAPPDLAGPDLLPHSFARLMTPHVALCLALHMGACEIGLIGVDLTDNHFFGETGRHEWAAHTTAIDEEFARLSDEALARGCRIFNLSETSRLTAFPKISLEHFAALPEPDSPAPRPLRIVSYATTPLVGVPATLARCINAGTPHRARCVWGTDHYENGISFTPDLDWHIAPARAAAELQAADLVILHNGKVDERHRGIIDSKPVVTMAHNYPSDVDDRYVRLGFPGLVVGQYQATLPEFTGWEVVANPLLDRDGPVVPRNTEVTIAYTPPDRHEIYPRQQPLYWHSKGYAATIETLERLAARHKISLLLNRDRFVSHTEALEMKRRAHIVIDECVTGSYHRNSLEGLAAGCVVVNGVGLLPGVWDALRRCAEPGADNPFIASDLERLESTLETLIELGPDLLLTLGAANQAWIERNWNFARQWDRFWQPAIDSAIRHVDERTLAVAHAVHSGPHLEATA